MFASLKNKIKEETGNDICSSKSAFSPMNRRNSLSLNNFKNNLNETSHQSAFVSNGIAGNHSNVQSPVMISPIDQLNTVITQKNNEIAQLNKQLDERQQKLTKLSTDYTELSSEKNQLEKSKSILDEALKVAQNQKELIHSEQDKIQNLQSQEITKLKSLLHFREQVCFVIFI